MIKRPELLAPAGSLEKAKWAFHYGADAVYIGGRDYSLRANATNFSIDEMKELCEFAHKNNKKVYVTVNIVFHDKDFNGLEEYLLKLNEINVDAIIVSDLYVLDLASKIVPDLEVHISTQASSLNYESVNYYEKKGATRVVLGRELSEEELKEIREKTNIELEMFIHGATCSSYSGRCTLSNYMTNRDSNRGGCSQICRWNFTLCNNNMDEINNTQLFSMSTKDLSMLSNIPKLIDMGITSFKIEGRMRSIYYIATIVHTYRKVIDAYCNGNYEYDQNLENIVRRCANRDSVPHFFNRTPDENEQYYIDRQENSNQDFLAIVLDYDGKTATLEQRNYFKPSDNVTVFGPNTKEYNFTVGEIRDIDNNILDAARHPQQIVKIDIDNIVYKDDIIRIKV